jgi:hypothetical protein
MSEDTEITAYCVKCKAVRPVKDAAPVYMANGRPATRGVCPECGTGLFKIGETPAHANLPKPEKVEAPRRAKAAPQPAGEATAPSQAAPSEAAPSASAPLTQPVQAYCVKCKTMRTLKAGRARCLPRMWHAAV